MLFRDITKGLKIIGCNIDSESIFDSVTDDFSQCGENAPFICLKGEKFNGNDFIGEAEKRGAPVICEKLPDNYKGKYLLVDNARKSDAIIHSNLCGNPERRLKVIGVTGTNGKTTVCHMLRAVLENSGHPCGITGTVGSIIGGIQYESTMTTPKTSELYRLMKESVEAGDEYFIIEVSSHALVYDKFAPIIFTLSLFTNLSPEHLDFHKNITEYARAKSRLFEKSVMSLVNIDDRYGKYMYEHSACLRYRYSALGIECEFSAKDKVDKGENGIEYYLIAESGALKISSPISGVFTFSNTLASASAGLLLGIKGEDICLSLSTAKGVKGRLEKINTDDNDDIDVYIDFAHTPEALKSMLQSVRNFAGKRKITVVFGCGGDRDKTKRPVMGRIASHIADRVIVTSDNSRSENPDDIINDILSGICDMSKVTVIENREEAIKTAVSGALKGDIIIIAGKGHENYEIDRNGKHVFSERSIISDCLVRRMRKNEGSDN